MSSAPGGVSVRAVEESRAPPRYIRIYDVVIKRDWHTLTGIWHDHCASQSGTLVHVRDVVRIIR